METKLILITIVLLSIIPFSYAANDFAYNRLYEGSQIIDSLNYSINVNHSTFTDYWITDIGVAGTVNATQFDINSGTLTIDESWFDGDWWSTTDAQTGLTGDKTGSFDLTTTGNITVGGIIDSSLTNEQIPYADSTGKLLGSDNLNFDGTNFSIGDIATSWIFAAKGSTNGLIFNDLGSSMDFIGFNGSSYNNIRFRAGSTEQVTIRTDGDTWITLIDNAGSNKLYIKDGDAATVASIDSEGNLIANSVTVGSGVAFSGGSLSADTTMDFLANLNSGDNAFRLQFREAGTATSPSAGGYIQYNSDSNYLEFGGTSFAGVDAAGFRIARDTGYISFVSDVDMDGDLDVAENLDVGGYLDVVGDISGTNGTFDATMTAERYEATANSGTILNVTGDASSTDVTLWRVGASTGYGFYQLYRGTGSGNANALELWTEGQAGTDVQVYDITQDGAVDFLDNDVSTSGDVSTGDLFINPDGLSGVGNIMQYSKSSSDTISTIHTMVKDRGDGTGGVGFGLRWLMQLENGAGSRHDAVNMEVSWLDPTDTSEDVRWDFNVMEAGSYVTALRLDGADATFGGDINITGNITADSIEITGNINVTGNITTQDKLCYGNGVCEGYNATCKKITWDSDGSTLEALGCT